MAFLDTHALTVSETRRAILRIDDVNTLRVTRDHERAHPEYDGGRKGVLDALEERLGELSVDDPSEGLARQPGSSPGSEVPKSEVPEPEQGDHVYIYDGQGQKHRAVVTEVLPKSHPIRARLFDESGTEVVAAYDSGAAAGTWREVE